MNRSQRRSMHRYGIIRLISIEDMRDQINSSKPQSVFDKNRIANDKKLYEEYNLPIDGVMALSIEYFIEECLEKRIFKECLKYPDDNEKIKLFKEYFDLYVKGGCLMRAYESTSKMFEEELNEACIAYRGSE